MDISIYFLLYLIRLQEPLLHLPWGNNRPYNDGERYNSLMLETDTSAVAVNDEPEYKTYCPLCSLSGLVTNVLVRGVCAESLLDSAYTLTVSLEGDLWYLGKFSSSIRYNRTSQAWQWIDKRDNASFALRD